MKPTMCLQRCYFFVVMGFTLFVGSFGFLWPQEILRALPWPMPPLHARFVGALYLGASLFLLLALLARSRLQTRTIVDIAFVWTGWLLVVTVVHWDRFDPARVQVWYWVGAYTTFPAVAWWLRRAGPPPVVPPEARISDAWVPPLLAGLGTLLIALAAALFLRPGSAVDVWPWKITPFLAQLYSGPLLGFGAGCGLLAARRNWPETLIPMLGLGSAALLVLLGSSWHLALFTPGSPSKALWFGSLGVVAVLSTILSGGALRQGFGRRRRGAALASSTPGNA